LNLVPLRYLRWEGNEEIGKKINLVLLQPRISPSLKQFFTTVLGVKEEMTVEDYIAYIRALQGQQTVLQNQDFPIFLEAYSSLNVLLEKSVGSTLHPLDGLPLLIEKGRGNYFFETVRHYDNPKNRLPYVDDWLFSTFQYISFAWFGRKILITEQEILQHLPKRRLRSHHSRPFPNGRADRSS